jgi:hypothetical protein
VRGGGGEREEKAGEGGRQGVFASGFRFRIYPPDNIAGLGFRVYGLWFRI